jgi:hypothetical protein
MLTLHHTHKGYATGTTIRNCILPTFDFWGDGEMGPEDEGPYGALMLSFGDPVNAVDGGQSLAGLTIGSTAAALTGDQVRALRNALTDLLNGVVPSYAEKL